MKTILCTVALAACFSVPLASNAHGQQFPDSANASKFHIAVVDVSFVFKKHARFKATMEGMKNDMKSIEQELKGEMEKIKRKEGERDSFDLGTADWKRLDNELTQMKASFSVQRTQRQKQFVEKEAHAYYQTYLEVNDAVRYYAQRNDIGLVLRFNGAKVDPNQHQQILGWINKPVIFHNQVDITGEIIALLNQDALQQQPTTSAPVRGAAIPGQPTRRRQ